MLQDLQGKADIDSILLTWPSQNYMFMERSSTLFGEEHIFTQFVDLLNVALMPICP